MQPRFPASAVLADPSIALGRSLRHADVDLSARPNTRFGIGWPGGVLRTDGIAAACTALRHLIGHVVNEARYRSYSNLALLCIIAIIVFTVRGLASTGRRLLAQTTNALTAENQERMSTSCCMRTRIFFLTARRSARAAGDYGAACAGRAPSLISTIGRDGPSSSVRGGHDRPGSPLSIIALLVDRSPPCWRATSSSAA